jgi:hypothetical protein
MEPPKAECATPRAASQRGQASLQARQFPPRGASRSGSRLLNGDTVVQIHPRRPCAPLGNNTVGRGPNAEQSRWESGAGHHFRKANPQGADTRLKRDGRHPSLGFETSVLFAVPPGGHPHDSPLTFVRGCAISALSRSVLHPHWPVAQEQSIRLISGRHRSITGRANHFVLESESPERGDAVLTRSALIYGAGGAGPPLCSPYCPRRGRPCGSPCAALRAAPSPRCRAPSAIFIFLGLEA